MPSEMKLSIIIISFNTKELLAQCLRSVYESCLPFSWEIIVVDNASSDGSAEMVAAAYPEVTVLRNKTNALFAKANNQGADVARGEYLLLLNSDTIVESGNIEKLVAFLDNASDRVACVGPTVLNGDRTVQSVGYALPSIRERIAMCFRLSCVLPKWLGRVVLPTGTPGLEDGRNHRVGWVSGCCMLLRRDVYKRVGGLNPELQFYGEEPELGVRLTRHRYETWLVPE